MSAPPKTELQVSAAEAEAIRAAVRQADPDWAGGSAGGRRLATEADIQPLADLLSDPTKTNPGYDLPRPITSESVAAWVRACEAARQRGEALLLVTRDDAGQVSGYSKITVWPDRSAAELAGAIRADRQGSGQGGAGAFRTIDWMFDVFGVWLV